MENAIQQMFAHLAVPGIPDTEDAAVECIETLLSRSFHFTGVRLTAKGLFL